MKSVYSGVGLFTTAVLAASRTSAPSGCVTVSQSGSGDFKTVQSAVDSDPPCIFIEPGTYNEQVLIEQRSASPFSIYGSTDDDTSFAANTVTLVYGLSQDDGIGNDETGTLRVKTDGFRLYNVNVENSRGEGSQAVALSAYADSGYYGCAFSGFQDTLLANEGRQIYLDTQVVGATDFIFGQRALAWFERADIRCVAKSIGYVTAHGRDEDNGSIYVFDRSAVSGVQGESVPAGAYYLGRPWRSWARVIFQRTEMSEVINPAGWRVWNDGQPNTENVYYGEFENTGAGSEGDRADFATAMDAAVVLGDVLVGYESADWFDASYYAGKGADVGDS